MRTRLTLLLKNHWLFGCLTPAELEITVGKLLSKRYASGEFIFHQNDVSCGLYIIISGGVSIETMSLNGQVTIIASLLESEIFGEFALIDGEPRSASARVSKAAEIAYLDKHIFLDLIAKNPQFSLGLASGLIHRLRRSNLQVESLNTQSLKNRMLETLLYLCKEENGVTIRLTQAQLADRVSGSREKVNMNLKALERKGTVSIKRGQVTILDVSEMKRGLLTD